MKIKRPLINQYYEDDHQEPEEPKSEPLERPSFAYIKPLEQAKEELDNPPEPKEVIIQTKPSEEFLRKKAQMEAEQKARLDQELENIKLRQAQQATYEQVQKRLEEQKKAEEQRVPETTYIQPVTQLKSTKPSKQPLSTEELPLPKTAVRAEDMPQLPKVTKKAPIVEKSLDQLEFGITPKRITFKQRLSYLRMYFERRQEILEISMLWKNPSLPFNIVSVIFVIGLLFVGGIFEFDNIPLKIPLFYDHVEKSWEQTDKSTLFILGIVLLLTEALLINLIIKIFKSDRRLALTLSWVITFINVLIIIASLQIYSLIT